MGRRLAIGRCESLGRVGFFCELPHGQPDGPSLRDAVRKLGADKRPIVAYLRRGAVLAASGANAYDALSPTQRRIGGLAVLTDGEWMWPSDLPHYVEEYEVELPAAFLRHGERLHWTPTMLSELDLKHVEDRLFGQRAENR